MFFGKIRLADNKISGKDPVQHLGLTKLRTSRDVSPHVWSDDRVALCYVPSGIKTLDESPQPFTNTDASVVAVFEGKIHNAHDIKRELGSAYNSRSTNSGEVLIPLYQRYGDSFPTKLNGKFAFALWDANQQKLLLGRDHLGIESLYYMEDR
ncbi:unnamed protein product, partial [marine sediment metagenome]